MADVIERTQDVSLERPVMVVALSGWVDAGTAGATATKVLEDEMADSEELARVDLSEVADLQQTRPMIELVDGVTRDIVWPAITFVGGQAGRDVIVCRGAEPSVRWREFAAEIVELARDLDVRMLVTLGGMPSPVSHRRPLKVLATASARSVAQEVEPVRLDYTGPTGAQTVIQVAAGAADIPAVGLWAQVPHYLSGTISPVAARALLSRLREIAGVEADLSTLDREAQTYLDQVEETISQRADIAELVDRLDAQVEEELPTGDELVSEIEEFLRREG